MAGPKLLKKELGFFSVFALATGATLSAGFFLLPGYAAAQAGPAVPLAYLLAAIPLIPATLSIVELATAMPRAGGAYYFLDRSLGPLIGTVGGLGTWLALTLKTSFALVGMGAYLSLFFTGLDANGMKYLAIGLALFFGLVNLFGAKGAAKFQVVLVSGLLLILTGFLLSGSVQMDTSNFNNFFAAGSENLLATAGLVYISYVGVTKVASVAEEVKNPEKTLPRAVILSLLATILIYALGTSIMVGVLGVDQLSGHEFGHMGEHIEHDKLFYAPVAATAKETMGDAGMIVVSIAAILAFFSVANAGILSASRYPLAMSRDHLIPPQFQTLNKKGNPTLGVLVTVGLIVLLLLTLDVKAIAKLASAFQLMIFALLCVACIAMREAKIDSYDPSFRTPFYPWTQIVGIVAPLVLVSQMGWQAILFSTSMIGFAVAWYLRYGRSRVNREGAIFHVFQRLGQRRHEALDSELRTIMIEKGLREEDPFDEVVLRADVVELEIGASFEEATSSAAAVLKQRTSVLKNLELGFSRESQLGYSTLGKGVAIPHLRIPGLERPEMALVRSTDGIPFTHLDEFGDEHAYEEPLRAIFFLISPEENPGQHLRLLAHLAGRVDDDEFFDEWVEAENEQDLREVLLRNERYVSLVVDRESATADWANKKVLDLGLAAGCLVAVIRRDDQTFVPNGQSVILEGDRITIIGAPLEIKRIYDNYL